MIVFSNAKINLGLNIVSKRPDNYHNIETIFCPIDLCDTIEILPSNTFKLTVYGLNIDTNVENNLCYKAFQVLKKEYSIPYVHIIFHKNIPIGAGLGGGSSNASFVLKALNEMFHLSLTSNQLAFLAEQLGSDCPFFINNKILFATGKGNVFHPIDINLSGYYIVIIKKNIHIPTSWAYSLIKPKQPKTKINEIVQNIAITEWKYHLKNDFEEHIFKYYPQLSEIKEWFYKNNAIYASMSGSGSSIFAIYNKEPKLDVPKDVFYWSGKII